MIQGTKAAKIAALILQGSTPGERAAARAAQARIARAEAGSTYEKGALIDTRA